MMGIKEKQRENVNWFALGPIMEIRKYDNEIIWLHKRMRFLDELNDSHIPKKYSIPWRIPTVAYKKFLFVRARARARVCFPSVSSSNFSHNVGSTRKIQLGFQRIFSLLLFGFIKTQYSHINLFSDTI